MDKLILLIDSHHGIYIPAMFCGGYANGEFNFTIDDPYALEAIEHLNNSEDQSDGFWDSWDAILANATLTPTKESGLEGQYILSQHDGDLWMVHHSVQFDDFGYPIVD